MREIRLGSGRGRWGRGPNKDVCDWWVLLFPGSSNGSLVKSWRRANEEGMDSETSAALYLTRSSRSVSKVVVQELGRGLSMLYSRLGRFTLQVKGFFLSFFDG